MKKMVFVLFSAVLIAGLSGCQKEYQCTQLITKQVDGIEIEQNKTVLYSNDDLSGQCFNYQQTVNDTVTTSVTTCK